MTERRIVTALLVVAAATAVVAFLFPVHAEGFDNCGVAGPWVTAVGDPTGPTDPPGAYAEFNACRVAARPALAVMLIGMLVSGVAGFVLIREGRNRR
jgi:hypothetical protein